MHTIEAFDPVEVGRRIGHDLHRWSLLAAQADWPHPVQEGFGEAAARRGRRSAGDRFQRKWLQLRLGAYHRQRAVSPEVTPDLLRLLDLTHCPITRAVLTHGTRADTDASVDRLNNDGAYAPGNLAVMSVRANRAKKSLRFEQVLALARGDVAPNDALTQAEWLRVAVLMEGPAFTARHDTAPLLPLVAPLPCRSVRLAIQQVQRLFTLHAQRPSGKNALVRAFSPAASTDLVRLRLRLLADAVHVHLKELGPDELNWDVWLRPRVMDALGLWRASLSAHDWSQVARISAQLAGSQRLTTTSLRAWQLPSRGYLPQASPGRGQAPLAP